MIALYELRIIHGNIKPENFKLTLKNSFILANFENARKANNRIIHLNRENVGEFTAPEIKALSTNNYSLPFINAFASDIYSLGKVINKLY